MAAWRSTGLVALRTLGLLGLGWSIMAIARSVTMTSHVLACVALGSLGVGITLLVLAVQARDRIAPEHRGNIALRRMVLGIVLTVLGGVAGLYAAAWELLGDRPFI